MSPEGGAKSDGTLTIELKASYTVKDIINDNRSIGKCVSNIALSVPTMTLSRA